jgi:hypothetical protein
MARPPRAALHCPARGRRAGAGRLLPRRFWRPIHVTLPRLGRRAEKRASGDGLTMPAPARVIREPERNQLGLRLIRASVANQGLRGRERLRRIFDLTLSRWPHRAGRPTWLVRHAPQWRASLQVADWALGVGRWALARRSCPARTGGVPVLAGCSRGAFWRPIHVTLPRLGPSARGVAPAAFDERCISASGVATRSHTVGLLARRAWTAERIARLGATRGRPHGLSARKNAPSAMA